jgi:pimeloyl-ACP methyl ester carboxylesterase
VADMQIMAAQNPHVTLHVIPGVGHICNHEAPVQVEQLLQRYFLD